METAKIERVAQALHRSNDERSKPRFRVAWEDCLPVYREMLLANARTAIEAMEGCTETAQQQPNAAKATLNETATDGA